MSQRRPLTRERIVEAAVRVADREGLAAVSMRSVGREVGAEAMSLYHHVRSKDDLLDALGDWIFISIEPPQIDAPWREAMRQRANETRSVLSAHPWALNLIGSRSAAGTATLQHHDAVLGCLRTSGFPIQLAGHAFSVLDAYVYGFAVTEQNIPLEQGQPIEEFVAGSSLPLDDFPFLAEYVSDVVMGTGFAYADEFEYGLDLILDHLEVMRTGLPGRPG